jgi:hypothetical protein
MHKILHLCWVLLITGCAKPDDIYTPPTGAVRYHPRDWSKAVELSDSFSAAISEALAKEGKEWKGTGGWKMAPRGVIAVGDSQYSYYGGFMTREGMKWELEIFGLFWKHLNENGEESAVSFNPEA